MQAGADFSVILLASEGYIRSNEEEMRKHRALSCPCRTFFILGSDTRSRLIREAMALGCVMFCAEDSCSIPGNVPCGTGPGT